MVNSETNIEILGTLQREAWVQRELPPVERIDADLWSIPVPMPDNPLRYVSVYVFASESDLTLIDAGWDGDEAWDSLRAGLAEVGASIADVSGILITHQHFDHIGLARRIKEASGAWVGLHPADRDQVMRPEYRQSELSFKFEADWLVSLGASRTEAERVLSRDWDPRSLIPEPDRLIEGGDVIDVSGRRLRAVHTPGHTPGHLCFVDTESRRFFSGDHVLPRISPNISAVPGLERDMLGEFLDSLDAVSEFEVDEVLPAHEWRFRGLPLRTAQLRAHHSRRLAELVAVIHRSPGSAPWDLAGQLTWSRPWEQYDGYMRLSAVGETMAHVAHLLKLGTVVATDDDVPRYYAAM